VDWAAPVRRVFGGNLFRCTPLARAACRSEGRFSRAGPCRALPARYARLGEPSHKSAAVQPSRQTQNVHHSRRPGPAHAPGGRRTGRRPGCAGPQTILRAPAGSPAHGSPPAVGQPRKLISNKSFWRNSAGPSTVRQEALQPFGAAGRSRMARLARPCGALAWQDRVLRRAAGTACRFWRAP